MNPETRALRAQYVLDTYREKMTPRSIQVFTALANGASLKEISTSSGTSVEAVRRVQASQLKRFGIQTWTPPPGWSPPVIDRSLRQFRAKYVLTNHYDKLSEISIKLLTAIADGKTNPEAALAAGTTEGYVKNAFMKQLLRFGCSKITPEDPNPIRKEPKIPLGTQRKLDRWEEVRYLHSCGLGVGEISRKLGESRHMINDDHRLLSLTPHREIVNEIYWLSVSEATRVKNFTENRVLERRLARGMTIGEMAIVDGRERKFILADMERLGVPIPDHENWTPMNGEKVPFYSRKGK